MPDETVGPNSPLMEKLRKMIEPSKEARALLQQEVALLDEREALNKARHILWRRGSSGPLDKPHPYWDAIKRIDSVVNEVSAEADSVSAKRLQLPEYQK